jgi:hypothetical protein
MVPAWPVPDMIFKNASINDKGLLLVKTGKRHALTSKNPFNAGTWQREFPQYRR